MAKKTEPTIVLERTYNVPLRKEFQKVARWKKTKKAVTALKQFLTKHMKSEDVKLGKEINEKLWQHGIQNPPHHIKVNVQKDSEGVVKAELFGVVKKEKVVEKKTKNPTKDKKVPKASEKPTPAQEAKAEEQKQEQKALQQDPPAPKEEKPAQVKDEKATQAVPSTENQKF
jgi:large subunit ribosomal protein L31e